MDYDYYKETNKKSIKGKIAFLVVLVVLAVAAIIGSSIYMHLIQLKELNSKADYSVVFTTNLLYQVIFFFSSFIVISLLVFISNKIIIKNLKKYLINNNLEARRMINTPLALLVGLFGAFLTKEYFYNKVLLFLNYVPFRNNDPQFG